MHFITIMEHIPKPLTYDNLNRLADTTHLMFYVKQNSITPLYYYNLNKANPYKLLLICTTQKVRSDYESIYTKFTQFL